MTNNHIQENLFHEYLDAELEIGERKAFEIHIDECQICRSELAQLRKLFLVIESVPESSLQVDFSQAMMDSIVQPTGLSKQWKRVVATQFAIAILLILIAWPALSSSFEILELLSISTDINPIISNFSTQISFFSTMLVDSFDNLLINMSSISLQVPLEESGAYLLPLIIFAPLLWIAGNNILLRGTHSTTT